MLHLHQSVSKEKQNLANSNYYLILYVHVCMHHVLKQDCVHVAESYFIFSLNMWLIIQWMIPLLCTLKD